VCYGRGWLFFVALLAAFEKVCRHRITTQINNPMLMKNLRVLVSSLVVTVFTFVAATPTRAADEGAGWYTKADVGISFVQDVKVHTTDLFGT